MIIKQFKNGNFNLKASELGADLAYDIAYSMQLDFAPFGEMYSIGNSALAWNYYNGQNGLIYSVSSIDQEDYKQGKTVKLLPMIPDEDHIEQMEQEGIL